MKNLDYNNYNLEKERNIIIIIIIIKLILIILTKLLKIKQKITTK